MSDWTHLIRFVAVEDGQTHLGQLVDTTRDIGEDSSNGIPIKAFRIEDPSTPGESPKRLCKFIEKHAQEANIPIPKVPALFTKPRTAITDPFPSTVKIPKFAQDGTSDYEAELVVVIGKSARDITAEEAPAYILGYTAANDISARTAQMESAMPTFSKGLDSSCPIGPVLVSAKTITNPQSLPVKAIYNGKTMQDGNTSDMVFSVYELVAYLSQEQLSNPAQFC